MPVYEIDDVLAGFKTILAGVDASPQPALANRYAWPADKTIDYTTFPFVICAEVLNQDFNFTPMGQGSGWHRWQAELLFCLANGPLTRLQTQATAEAKHQPWVLAVATVLFANRSVGGTCLDIGTPNGPLFSYRVGNIGWSENHTFWGIRFIVPVVQEQSLPSL